MTRFLTIVSLWILTILALAGAGCSDDSGSGKSGQIDTGTGTPGDTATTPDTGTATTATNATETTIGVDTASAVDTSAPPDTATDADSATATDTGTEPDSDSTPPVSDCNDGIDNDSDGYVDWQYDLGCVNGNDDEISGTRAEENGFTTFDVGPESIVIYVSAQTGEDANDGLSPVSPVKTLSHAASLLRDGEGDFMLLRRGDTWRGESLGRFFSGRDAEHPMVIASYGDSTDMPRVEIDTNFIDHNGKVRNYVAIVGLELVSYPLIPGDPAYDGETGGGFRYVGGGTHLLIEGCRMTHGELVVQSYGDDAHYEDVEVRRNVIELNYHINTCGQNNEFRPSGMYSSHVTDLTIEGNIFDHNGWNEDVASACATMYNHNMYLNADNLIVRDNLISRASSMGIKMRSDETGDADTLLFENNFFVDGEIGMGIGGNTENLHRFSNVTIRNNVFSQIGLGNPTERNFAWMLEVSDVLTATIDSNYFLHQPWYSNAYGISLTGGSTGDITVSNNVFYDLASRSLRVQVAENWGMITVDSNTFVDMAHDSCLVNHQGDFATVQYQNNRYYSSESTDWFCGDVDGTLADWQAGAGETDAAQWSGTFSDPNRTISSYAESLGLDASLEGFLAAARVQSRLNWNSSFTAPAINNYIKSGF